VTESTEGCSVFSELSTPAPGPKDYVQWRRESERWPSMLTLKRMCDGVFPLAPSAVIA
jgi:hypothetical protein